MPDRSTGIPRGCPHPMTRWTTEQSADLYLVEKWGHPYVSVNEKGRVSIHPDATPEDLSLIHI